MLSKLSQPENAHPLSRPLFPVNPRRYYPFAFGLCANRHAEKQQSNKITFKITDQSSGVAALTPPRKRPVL